jgi:hypothetical protein
VPDAVRFVPERRIGASDFAGVAVNYDQHSDILMPEKLFLLSEQLFRSQRGIVSVQNLAARAGVHSFTTRPTILFRKLQGTFDVMIIGVGAKAN